MTALSPAPVALRAAALFTAAALAVGCGGGRKTCYPVSGTVLVNGKAAADCLVRFDSHDPADHDGPNRVLPLAMADEKGRFQLSTYAANDGAPAGEYTVTFTWRERSGLLKNQFDGPDRLKGKYAMKESSGIKVTLGKGPQELPPFELTTK